MMTMHRATTPFPILRVVLLIAALLVGHKRIRADNSSRATNAAGTVGIAAGGRR